MSIGDSGGPVLILDHKNDTIEYGNPRMDKIVGIVSFGDTCEDKILGVSAHTQVNDFIDWINEILEDGPMMCQVGSTCQR